MLVSGFNMSYQNHTDGMRANSIIFLVMLLGACIGPDPDLQRSIFIADPEFPELPGYSEWGYNTFGAYYDRQPFISNNVETPVKIIERTGSTSFGFTGQKGPYAYGTHDAFSMYFVVPDLQPETYEGLMVLHNSSWDLSDENIQVIVSEGSSQDTLGILNGSLTFSRAQYLIVDKEVQEVILSGRFEFQAIRRGVPITVSNGRFDVGIADHNFFRY